MTPDPIDIRDAMRDVPGVVITDNQIILPPGTYELPAPVTVPWGLAIRGCTTEKNS